MGNIVLGNNNISIKIVCNNIVKEKKNIPISKIIGRQAFNGCSFSMSANNTNIYIKIDENNTVIIPANYFAYEYCKDIEIKSEILYVGLSLGVKKDRQAPERLKNHPTLQKILSDYVSLGIDKCVELLLLEFSWNSQITSSPGEDIEVSKEGLEEKITNATTPMPKKEMISFIEAGLIYYYKPPYNQDLVNNPPFVRKKTYKQLFNLKYSYITIELDMDYEGKYGDSYILIQGKWVITERLLHII